MNQNIADNDLDAKILEALRLAVALGERGEAGAVTVARASAYISFLDMPVIIGRTPPAGLSFRPDGRCVVAARMPPAWETRINCLSGSELETFLAAVDTLLDRLSCGSASQIPLGDRQPCSEEPHSCSKPHSGPV